MAPVQANNQSLENEDPVWNNVTQSLSDLVVKSTEKAGGVWVEDEASWANSSVVTNDLWLNCSDSRCSNCSNILGCANCSELCTWTNCGPLCDGGEQRDDGSNLNEFHIIKAVVLVLVTSVLLISVCRMVLQLFVRYTNVKQDK